MLVHDGVIVARRAVEYLRLRRICDFARELGPAFLERCPADEREERRTPSVAFNGIRKAVVARDYLYRVLVSVIVICAARPILTDRLVEVTAVVLIEVLYSAGIRVEGDY